MQIILISTSTYPSDQGIRQISSCLKQRGHSVKIIFMTASEDYTKFYHKKSLEQLAELCKDASLIGIASYASTAKRAIQIIQFLKNHKETKSIQIVWGGVHATICPDECIKYADIVAVGESELAIIELADAIADTIENKKPYKKIQKIQNLWIKNKDGSIIKNPVRPLITNLDSLPPADYDIENHYILRNKKINKFRERDLAGQIFFLTGRGCPYSCTYCSNKVLNESYAGGKVRHHSPEYIISCIKHLREKFPSLKYFDIRDDTFSFRTLENIKEFCERYKKEINMRFKCLADVKTLTEEKLKLLINAGCTDIIIGIQGSEKINLNLYKRPQTDIQVLKAAQIINKYTPKLAVMYDVITSNPYETKEDILSLINLLRKIPPPYYLSVNNLVFFTGSDLYKKAKLEGIIKTEKDSAAYLNYWDRWKHIKLKKKNEYLNLILNLMRGPVTKKRFGIMPIFLLNFLLKEHIINFNLKHKSLTYIIGNLVGISDFIREKVAKPVYRNFLPITFKAWFDAVRYRV